MARAYENPARTRGAHNRLRVAVGLSLLFHLSMVTVFSIVIYFPRQDLRFYQLQIAQEQAAPEVATDATSIYSPALRDPLSAGPFASDRSPRLGLPAISLPTVELAESRRLRLRRESFSEQSLYDRLYPEQTPGDSWARFSQSLRAAGRSLGELALPSRDPDSKEEAGDGTFNPAEGFQGRVEWSDGAFDRPLLFAPPLEGLWAAAAADRRPLEFVIEVDAGGRVLNAWSPIVDGGELVEDVQAGLLQYRFEPLEGGRGATQLAIVYIRPAEDRAP